MDPYGAAIPWGLAVDSPLPTPPDSSVAHCIAVDEGLAAVDRPAARFTCRVVYLQANAEGPESVPDHWDLDHNPPLFRYETTCW